jgi:hypothetical protein
MKRRASGAWRFISLSPGALSLASVVTMPIRSAPPTLTRHPLPRSQGPRPILILSPLLPRAGSLVLSRQVAVSWFAIGMAVLILTGCRGDRGRLPASTQPLAEPPTAYPASTRTAEPANSDAPRVATIDDSVIWEHLGTWSGRGSMQTESFTGETGAFRIKWDTRAAPAPAKKPPVGTAAVPGTFKVTIHSSISGRPLQIAVDQSGPGADTAYVNEDPRVFFAVVDASNIEWSFSVDEAVGTRMTKTAKP